MFNSNYQSNSSSNYQKACGLAFMVVILWRFWGKKADQHDEEVAEEQDSYYGSFDGSSHFVPGSVNIARRNAQASQTLHLLSTQADNSDNLSENGSYADSSDEHVHYIEDLEQIFEPRTSNNSLIFSNEAANIKAFPKPIHLRKDSIEFMNGVLEKKRSQKKLVS